MVVIFKANILIAVNIPANKQGSQDRQARKGLCLKGSQGFCRVNNTNLSLASCIIHLNNHRAAHSPGRLYPLTPDTSLTTTCARTQEELFFSPPFIVTRPFIMLVIKQLIEQLEILLQVSLATSSFRHK